MLLDHLVVPPKTLISLKILTNLSSLLIPRTLSLKTSNVLRVLKRSITLLTTHRKELCSFTSLIFLPSHHLPFLLILRISPLRMRNVILIRAIFSLYNASFILILSTSVLHNVRIFFIHVSKFLAIFVP